VRAIVGLNKQGQSAARALADVDAAHEQPPHRETHVVQLLELAATYRQTSIKALALAQSQNNSEADEAPARGAPPAELDLDFSDPARAIEVLRSFDHAGYLQAITKTGSTIRKWQKQCKIYRERAKGKISFRDFAVGDLALFLPTRNSPLRPWAAFNGADTHPNEVVTLALLLLKCSLQCRSRIISYSHPTISMNSCKRANGSSRGSRLSSNGW
jgi:hypothetical protein